MPMGLRRDRGHLIAQSKIQSERGTQAHVVLDIGTKNAGAEIEMNEGRAGQRSSQVNWIVGQETVVVGVGQSAKLDFPRWGRVKCVQLHSLKGNAHFQAVNASGPKNVIVTLVRILEEIEALDLI